MPQEAGRGEPTHGEELGEGGGKEGRKGPASCLSSQEEEQTEDGREKNSPELRTS